MNSYATAQFWDLYNQLPSDIRRRADKAYRLWRRDPNNPGLHFKRLRTRNPIYSVRIGMRWRAIGVLEGDTMTWFWIGSHDDYERLLKQL
jgi:hypothetical protein